MIVYVAVAVVVASALYYGACKCKSCRYKERYELAKQVAYKHEELLAKILPAVTTLKELAIKAYCNEDACKFSTLENQIKYAIGMARKLGE